MVDGSQMFHVLAEMPLQNIVLHDDAAAAQNLLGFFTLRRNLDQTMRMENKGPVSSAPSPKDTINMMVTNFDMNAKKSINYELQYVAPCLLRWGMAPFGMVRSSKFSCCFG